MRQLRRLLVLLLAIIFFSGKNIRTARAADNLGNAQFFSNSSADGGSALEFSGSDTNTTHYYIPKNTPTPLEGVRWPSRRIKIYLASSNPQIRRAFRQAVKAWNRTRAVHFVWVKDEAGAQVVADSGDLSDNTSTSNSPGVATAQLGSTNTEFNPDTNELLHARSMLDPNELAAASPTFRSEVAQHELGHAIGLAHAPQYEKSVMVPRNVHSGITKNDVRSVRALYR